jgi:hypothetical protein
VPQPVSSPNVYQGQMHYNRNLLEEERQKLEQRDSMRRVTGIPAWFDDAITGPPGGSFPPAVPMPVPPVHQVPRHVPAMDPRDAGATQQAPPQVAHVFGQYGGPYGPYTPENPQAPMRLMEQTGGPPQSGQYIQQPQQVPRAPMGHVGGPPGPRPPQNGKSDDYPVKINVGHTSVRSGRAFRGGHLQA